ncbi:MAG: Ig-like domain-containing protein [Bacteroidia bacterium]|nr:Ig-like domain-containing protein [Bacteroidia bacterium]
MKVLFFGIFFLSACASIQTLDGGEKDVTPPEIVATTPDSAQLFVTNPLIELRFDEYIKTKNAADLLIISPSQIKAPTITVKGKKVFIQLNDSLKKNTTYSINFNGSIVDFNEGNPMDYFKYVFSTGSYIDSFSYQGNVSDVLSTKACNECNVHLYKSFNDSLILTTKPDYIVRTSESGSFIIDNLPLDSFLVYAIKDQNKNLLLDDKDYISISKIINTNTNKNDSIAVFPYNTKKKNKPKVLSSTKPGVLKIAFEHPVSTLSTDLTSSNRKIKYSFNRTRDTLTSFYFPDSDSSFITLTLDTFSYSLIYLKRKKTKQFNLTAYSGMDGIYISTDYTIDSINYSKLRVIQDSIVLENKPLKSDYQTITINSSFDKAKKLTLEIDSGFIRDYYNNTNRTDTLIISPKLIENPSLQLIVNLSDTGTYIIQLISRSKVINQYKINQSKTLTIPNLNPGLYELVLIKDTNRNGLWDSGNPFTKLKPENRKISESFEMRLNWDKELIINDL